MKRHSLAITTLSAVLLVAVEAYPKSININPMLTGQNSSYVQLEDAALADQAFSNHRTPGRKFLYVTYHWDHHPWVLLSKDRRTEIGPIVDSMHTIDLGFSWLLSDDLQLGIQSFGSLVDVSKDYGSDSGAHWGDSRLQLKYRFLTNGEWNMAIAPELTIPSEVGYIGHTNGASVSNSSYAPGAKLIGEYRTSENQWTFNFGYTYYDKAEMKLSAQNYPQIDGRSRVFIGTGWLTKLSAKWALDTEYSNQLTPGVNHFTPPGLLTVGGRYGETEKGISWHFGAGTGSLGTPGGNDPVLYAGVKIPFFGAPVKTTDTLLSSYSAAEPAHDSAKYYFTKPTPTPPPVADDQAYRKALMDRSDDVSNLDVRELDPYMQPAPVAEPEEEPVKPLYTQAEVTKSVVYKKKEIQVLKEVEFNLNKSNLTPRGKQIVHQVAKVILAHKADIKNVTIKGHTDHLGNDRINNPLSQARARTVRSELIAKGVPKNMLSAQGYGSQKPIYNYKTQPRSLWKKNRRVEFDITQKK